MIAGAAASLRHHLIDAARQFNAGRYFEAHEVLEEALDVTADDFWELVVGLVQVAVGYHKLSQQLHSGAIGMFEIGLEKLDVFPATAAGLNIKSLRERVRADLDALRAGRLDPQSFARRPPRLQLVPLTH